MDTRPAVNARGGSGTRAPARQQGREPGCPGLAELQGFVAGRCARWRQCFGSIPRGAAEVLRGEGVSEGAGKGGQSRFF